MTRNHILDLTRNSSRLHCQLYFLSSPRVKPRLFPFPLSSKFQKTTFPTSYILDPAQIHRLLSASFAYPTQTNSRLYFSPLRQTHPQSTIKKSCGNKRATSFCTLSVDIHQSINIIIFIISYLPTERSLRVDPPSFAIDASIGLFLLSIISPGKNCQQPFPYVIPPYDWFTYSYPGLTSSKPLHRIIPSKALNSSVEIHLIQSHILA